MSVDRAMLAFENGAQLGYTLGTGKLFANFPAFQEWAEELLGRPILTHEFADERTWLDLRGAFEESALARLDSEATE